MILSVVPFLDIQGVYFVSEAFEGVCHPPARD
jgi:hypothetical protein